MGVSHGATEEPDVTRFTGPDRLVDRHIVTVDIAQSQLLGVVCTVMSCQKKVQIRNTTPR